MSFPLNTTTPQQNTVDVPYQVDGGRDWIETTLAPYRANAANAHQNMRLHDGYASLTGQENDFTIRCNC